jgi:hypothetical protein
VRVQVRLHPQLQMIDALPVNCARRIAEESRVDPEGRRGLMRFRGLGVLEEPAPLKRGELGP